MKAKVLNVLTVCVVTLAMLSPGTSSIWHNLGATSGLSKIPEFSLRS
jgi:hypothetical protein